MKLGKRSKAIWYCEECAPEEVRGSEACAMCCGYRSTCTLADLNDGQQEALTVLLQHRTETNIAWGPSDSVDKRSLYALERRGLVVQQRYYAVSKLTPAGIRLARELASAEVNR